MKKHTICISNNYACLDPQNSPVNQLLRIGFVQPKEFSSSYFTENDLIEYVTPQKIRLAKYHKNILTCNNIAGSSYGIFMDQFEIALKKSAKGTVIFSDIKSIFQVANKIRESYIFIVNDRSMKPVLNIGKLSTHQHTHILDIDISNADSYKTITKTIFESLNIAR